jgi:prolyl-tRNA editing enzyme YbaK/EbsC (Cys-tRNA(Pro) deacylase)
MTHLLKPSAGRVQAALTALGFANQVVELPDATHTAAEAATAVGCTIGQIAKSLVFATQPTGRPLLVIASGSNRVNEARLAALVGEALQKPAADFVREQTGFVIGGVPPIGHNQPLLTLIDEELTHYAEIWAAAGHPHAVFKLTPDELVRMTGGQVVAIK